MWHRNSKEFPDHSPKTIKSLKVFYTPSLSWLNLKVGFNIFFLYNLNNGKKIFIRFIDKKSSTPILESAGVHMIKIYLFFIFVCLNIEVKGININFWKKSLLKKYKIYWFIIKTMKFMQKSLRRKKQKNKNLK